MTYIDSGTQADWIKRSRKGEPLSVTQPLELAGFDPNEPREHGKWSKEGGDNPVADVNPRGFTGKPEEMHDWLEKNFTEIPAHHGTSDSDWFKDPKTGDIWITKEGGGTMENYYREGTNEVIGGRILDSMDLIHSPVSPAGDMTAVTKSGEYDTEPRTDTGNYWVALPHLANLDGVADVTDAHNFGFTQTTPSELEDTIRISMFDQVTQNEDGHTGQAMVVTMDDGTKRLAPVDNSLILGGRHEDLSTTAEQDMLGQAPFPEPGPMSTFNQYNDWRHNLPNMMSGYADWPDNQRIGDIYDKTSEHLRAGVKSLTDPTWISQFPKDVQDDIYLKASYMNRQVDALSTYREQNLRYLGYLNTKGTP